MSPWFDRAAWLVRLGLMAVFIWAGTQKARSPSLFALDLEAYQILPSSMALPIAYYLPWLEIFTAIALLIPSLQRAAGWLVLGLLMVFTVMLGFAWSRGLQINCGCFGAAGHATTDFTIAIARNVVLLGLAGWLQVREIAARRDQSSSTSGK